MHEASLVRSLLKRVQKLAAEHGAEQQGTVRVTAVRVTVGEFSGVEPDLLALAFEREIADTPLCSARLFVERTPLEAKCAVCEHEFAVQRFDFTCPSCGRPGSGVVTRGEELMLEGLTLEAVA